MQKMLRVLGDRRAALQNGEENQKGFTLIELLVVVIIIGILAAVAIPAFFGFRENAWRAQVESDLKNAALVAETYAVDNGSYAGLTDDDFADSESEGTTLAVTDVTSEGFTLTGSHKDLDAGATTLAYKSAEGGLGTWSDADEADDEEL